MQKKYFSLLIFVTWLNLTYAQNSITPLNIVVNATYTTIGVKWNVSGDTNYNSSLKIEYKKASQTKFKTKTIKIALDTINDLTYVSLHIF